MKKYTVVPLSPGQLPLLVRLFDYNDVEDMIRSNTAFINSGDIDIFALFDGDEIIGELRAKYRSADEIEAVPGRRAYLYAFRISEKYRGKGLGKYLMQRVTDMLTSRGYTEFAVGVEDDNLRAVHIYKSFGFTELIARKREEYQGDSYEYNLYLKRIK